MDSYEDPAAQAFISAQSRLLARYGVRARSRFVPTARGAAHVLETGRGDPLLLLHGGGAFAGLWAPLLPHLAPHARVLAPDRPGCGLTTAEDYQDVRDVRAHAAGFVVDVLDGLDVERATIVGHSLGGWFAVAFALAHPERVSRLVLVGAPAGLDRSFPLPLRLLGRRGVGDLLARTVAKPGTATTRGMFRRVLARRLDRVAPEMLEAAAAAARAPGAALGWRSILGRFSTLRGLRPDLVLAPDLARLAVPTTFVWGEQDPVVPLDRCRAVTASMPAARLVVVPDAAHAPWLDAPEAVGRAIVEALRDDPVASVGRATRA